MSGAGLESQQYALVNFFWGRKSDALPQICRHFLTPRKSAHTKNNTIHSDGVTIMGWVMGLEPTIFRATI